jgi:lysyl-tRNA synthetase class 2
MFRQSRIKQNLELRARVIQAARNFFLDQGYLEVETPIRIPAPAPEANIEAIESEGQYLHTSPELCMKRLLAAGYPRIFQICRCFRKEERGDRHLTEFTLLEWYSANETYTRMMVQCEDLIRFIAAGLGYGESLTYQGRSVSLKTPWPRMTVAEAFRRFAPVPADTALAQDRFDELLAFEIEPRLGNEQPVFLYDYPAACGSLARLKPDDPAVAERFELYMRGMELCNAFTELADAKEQRTRFEKELFLRAEAGRPVYPMPEAFLKALESMPPAAGSALGLDRLVMLFADAADIDQVTAFTPEEV